MADKTMWRGQSTKLTIEAIQDLTAGHIKSYTFDVMNGSTSANGSFSGAGDGTSNGRAISTSAHVAQGNTTGYTDYTVKGYLKYTHNSYGTQTVATSNTVTKSLRVQEPLDTKSLSGFAISPNEVWSNVADAQNITIIPSFTYIPFSKLADITCSQSVNTVGGGSDGASSLQLNGSTSVQYQNNNTNKDLGIESINIEFYAYSITGISAAPGDFLHSRSLTVKNAVTRLSISESLTTYNNAGLWNPNESVNYTPGIPYSKEVSLVYAETDDAYSGNSITKNGITVQLDSSTGAFTFNVSKATDVSKTSTFKFRVKSIEGAKPVYSNAMTFTVLGFTASHRPTVVEGETFTIENLGIGRIDSTGIPSNLEHVTVTTTADNLGIEIKGKAVSTGTPETFIITSTSGSEVTIECTVINLDDISCSINTGDTITITGQEIADAVGRGQTTITSISAIETSPSSGNGTAYVSKEGNLVYYAPDHAVENVPITVITDTGASVLINIKVVDITMSIA